MRTKLGNSHLKFALALDWDLVDDLISSKKIPVSSNVSVQGAKRSQSRKTTQAGGYVIDSSKSEFSLMVVNKQPMPQRVSDSGGGNVSIAGGTVKEQKPWCTVTVAVFISVSFLIKTAFLTCTSKFWVRKSK